MEHTAARPIESRFRGSQWSFVQAGAASLAVAAMAVDQSRVVWSANAPWIPSAFQTVGPSLSLGALAILALVGLASGIARPAGPETEQSSASVGRAAGIGLIVMLALSVLSASAPVLAVARLGDVAVGLAMCLAIAGRPVVRRWIVIACFAVIAFELPFVILQVATQSTYPAYTLVFSAAAETPATASGANVVIGIGGARWQRALGTFPHANVLGGFLAVSLVLALPWLLTTRLPGWLRYGIWGIGWLELALTFSRAAALAAAVGCGAWLLLRLTRGGTKALSRQVMIVAALVLLAASALAARPLISGEGDALGEPAVVGRITYLHIASQIIAAHPLRGVGGGNFPLAELEPPIDATMVDPVHVVPLLVAAEGGIPAGVFWLALVVGSPLVAWRHQRKITPDIRDRLAVMLAILVLSLLDHYLWSLPPGRALFWLALGAGVVR